MASNCYSYLPSTEYDYVIAGGGTAGLVVACRLSEEPNVRVLVLEAGENPLNDAAGLVPAKQSGLRGSKMDWNFETMPQAHLSGRKLRHPQGRTLGGSSAINAESWIAPSKADFDMWGFVGNPGWSWQAMLPYYRRSHTLSAPSAHQRETLGIDWLSDEFCGTNGPIQVSFQDASEDLLATAWIKAFTELGHVFGKDPSSGEATGGFSSLITVDPVSQTRSYAANTYYFSASARGNLDVVIGASVSKILFDGGLDPARAIGVETVVQGSVEHVNARREVILSAGTFQTPQLLELSGIGAADRLRSHGIPVILDNDNVGENLQDHLMTGISFEVEEHVSTGDALMRQEPVATQATGRMVRETKSGPLGAGGIGSYALVPLADVFTLNEEDERRNLLESRQSMPEEDAHSQAVRSLLNEGKEASGAMFMFPAQVNLQDESYTKDFLQDLLPGKFVSFGAALLHPMSRGSVHIMSGDVNDAPRIDPCYLSHPLDLEILARYLCTLETVAETDAFTPLIKKDGRRNHPAAYVRELENAKKYVIESSISDNNPVGTCAMMPKKLGGVVDERLLVYGTSNLRIVDASMMPTIPRGNIQSTVYAVAERAADLIKIALQY